MKKYLLSVFAAASMLFAASCSEEENFAESNKQSVTFKVEVEGAGASSRTITNPDDANEKIYIGQGEMVDKLFYAVYESKGADCLLEGEATVENGVATVVIPLVNGLEYDLVFLAYNKANNAFGIPSALTFDNGRCNAVDLENLTLKSGLFANTEAYDAFYHVKSNYVTNTSSTTPVVLHRMFAQLNVATTNEDLTNATQLNVNVTKTALELKNVPNQFNARTGQVGENRIDVPFAASAILKCADNNDKHEILAVKKDGENKYFNYLAMAYVLADEGKSLHDVNVSFYRDSETKSFHTRTIPSVPLQRQYRTNITGNILTQQEAFSISLDTTFVNREYNESVGDVVIISEGDSQALQAAIENAQPNVPVEIQLEGDITLGQNNSSSTFSRAENEQTYALKIDADQEITIDLNGFTISHEKACTASYSMITNNGKLTILDSSANGTGKISFKDTSAGDPNFGWGSYTISNYDGELVVENGTIEHIGEQNPGNGQPNVHMYCAIWQYSGSTTINGGTISTPTYRSVRLWKGDMTINNGTFDGQLWVQAVDNSAALTINGGSFEPNGNDGSSVFVGNETYDVTFSVTGGTFNTKIGCSDATKLVGSITGGTFTETAKDATNEALLAEGYLFEPNNEGTWAVNSVLVQVGEKAYEIHNLAGLKAFGNAVSNGNTFEGCTITLKNDIDLNNEQWIPIGNRNLAGNTFNGTFDGNGYTISNLKHHFEGEQYFVGLFGCLDNATIKDLIIFNVDIKLSGADTWGHIGAVAGWAQGTSSLQNITVNGLVKIEGEMTQVASQRIGAVVGGNQGGNISFTDVTVNADDNSYVKGNGLIGGISGQLQGESSFENCSSNINVTAYEHSAGGIIGVAPMKASLVNCNTTGNISVTNAPTDKVNWIYRVGGIVGSWAESTNLPLTLTDCSYTGTLVGKNINGETATTFDCDGYVGRGWNVTVGAKVVIDEDEYQYIGDGEYTINGYEIIADGVLKKGTEYQVSNANGLAYFSAKALTGNNGTAEEATIQIMNDIDMNGASFSAIIAQRGDKLTIVGNGKTISNVKVVSGENDNTTGQASMFYAFPNSTLEVSNLQLKNIIVTADKNASGYAAAVVGYCEGEAILNNVDVENATITGVKSSGMLIGHLSGSLKAEDCDLLGTVTLAEYEANGHYAGKYIGTLAGPATIKNCTVNVTISGNLNAANDGAVYGRKTAAGSLDE